MRHITNELAALLDRLGNHSKAELQELARQMEKPTKGTKDELITRLVEVQQEETWEYRPAPQ